MQAMKLNSITANRHIFDGKVNGRPLRLRLAFDGKRLLRLQVADDGERMLVDDGPLDTPFDMDDCGQVDIADITQALFPKLCGVEVADIEALACNGRRVGVKLNVVGGEPFHFWVYGDELYWGGEAALVDHEWLDGEAPKPSEHIEV